jgi:hypothetical protein
MQYIENEITGPGNKNGGHHSTAFQQELKE